MSFLQTNDVGAVEHFVKQFEYVVDVSSVPSSAAKQSSTVPSGSPQVEVRKGPRLEVASSILMPSISAISPRPHFLFVQPSHAPCICVLHLADDRVAHL
eukprot:7615654-Heterocapsa_arctica.AAC.1